jgi:hypothetical protein
MYIYTAGLLSAKDQITIYQQPALGSPITLMPDTNYTIEIQIPNFWEFKITWVSVPAAGTIIIVFRRTRGVINQFPVGAFLNAEDLNQRFNLDNLGINDTAYYQSHTNPMYSQEVAALHGTWTSIPSVDENPKMDKSDLNLPYLGTGSPAPDDIYTWGKKIDNIGYPGHGVFQQVLIESATGGGTVAQLRQELLDCLSELTAGGTLIGLWSAANPAMGWGGGCMKLEEWYVNMSKSATQATSGANQIGLFIGEGPHAGQKNVQEYLGNFCEPGAAPLYTTTAGASFVGYGGWALGPNPPQQTVAAALERLNIPATSPTSSGATHVKWWSGSASMSVQEALTRSTTEFTYQYTINPGLISPHLVNIPPAFQPYGRISEFSLTMTYVDTGVNAIGCLTIPYPQDPALTIFPIGGTGQIVIATIGGFNFRFTIDWSSPNFISITPQSFIQLRTMTVFLKRRVVFP